MLSKQHFNRNQHRNLHGTTSPLGAFFPPATLQPQPAQESARNNLTLGGVLSSSYTSTATKHRNLHGTTSPLGAFFPPATLIRDLQDQIKHNMKSDKKKTRLI
jgi:hypothetical protein